MRYTIDLPEGSHEKLAALAKSYKLTQGNVLEVLLETVAGEQLEALAQRHTTKKSPRVLARQLLDKYTPEELEELLKARQSA